MLGTTTGVPGSVPRRRRRRGTRCRTDGSGPPDPGDACATRCGARSVAAFAIGAGTSASALRSSMLGGLDQDRHVHLIDRMERHTGVTRGPQDRRDPRVTVLDVVDGVVHRPPFHGLDVEPHRVVVARTAADGTARRPFPPHRSARRATRTCPRACSSAPVRRLAGTRPTGRSRSRRRRDRSRAPVPAPLTRAISPW